MMSEKAKLKDLFSKISEDENIPLHFSEDEISLISDAVYNAGYRVCTKEGNLKKAKDGK